MNLIIVDHKAQRYVFSRGDERHTHIRRVLRANVGDALRIGVLDGPEGVATITELTAAGTVVTASWTTPKRPSLPVHVLLGHPRPPVLQRLWRDLSAMRVASIRVFSGVLGERSYLDSSIWSGLEGKIREGLSQGRHTARPLVTAYDDLEKIFDEIQPVRYGYYGSLEDAPSVSYQRMLDHVGTQGPSDVYVAIGPERGFAEKEVSLLAQQGFTGVSLGDAILRTETAAIGLVVGITSVLCASGATGIQ